MEQYADLLNQIKAQGVEKGDRTGTGTLSIFGTRMEFDLEEGFPLVTGKKTPFGLIKSELLWFLSGNENIHGLHEHNNHIWDEWVKEDGTFGPIYGKQWMAWRDVRSYASAFESKATLTAKGYRILHTQINKGPLGGETYLVYREINQLEKVIRTLRENPDDRRMIVSAWNVADVESGEMALPPCHVFFQFYVSKGKLSCQIYQRSCDVFLGVPFNIASYALLTHMVASLVGLAVGNLIWVGGDTHIYLNHLKQVDQYLSSERYSLPEVKLIGNPKRLEDFGVSNIYLNNYSSGPVISAAVST